MTLHSVFFPDTKPPAQHQASTETIVDMTLLRHRTTRGRTDSMDDAAYDERLGEVAIVIKDLLNGDWAQPRLQHYCWKPGASPAPVLHHPPPTTPHTTPHHTKPTPPPGTRHPTRTLPPPQPSITPHCHAISAAPTAPPHHTHPTPAPVDAEALCCCLGSRHVRDRSVAVERILSVLTEAFFEPLGTRLPSTNRWHTFGPTLAVQA